MYLRLMLQHWRDQLEGGESHNHKLLNNEYMYDYIYILF